MWVCAVCMGFDVTDLMEMLCTVLVHAHVRALSAQAVVRLTPEELATKEERDHQARTTKETVKKLTDLPSEIGRVESHLYKCSRWVVLWEED